MGDPGGVIPASLQTGLKADNQADFSPPKKGIRRREEEVEEDGSVRIFAARCPYREALQSIRTIFTEKEEQKLLAFRELEAQFPKERILAALKKRVAEAEGFADRGKRTSWILINAQDDLNDSARPAVSHPDDELRR